MNVQVARRRGSANKKIMVEEVEKKDGSTANLVKLSGSSRGVEILTADETTANRVHLELLDLKKTYETTYFEIAERLYKVARERLYTAKSCGAYETFEDYVENELEFKSRKGRMLKAIWWWYGIEQQAEPTLLIGAREIGWSKAHRLVEVVNKKNAQEWFKLARENRYKEFSDCVKAALDKAGKKRSTRHKPRHKLKAAPGMNPENPDESQFEMDGQAEVPSEGGKGVVVGDGVATPTEEEVKEVKRKAGEWVTKQFSVPKETIPTIKQAVDWAREIGKTTHEGYALSLICQHFLSFMHDKYTVVYGEWLASFERSTGLKVIAIDPEKDQVIYGQNHLDDDDGGDDEGLGLSNAERVQSFLDNLSSSEHEGWGGEGKTAEVGGDA